MSDMLQQVQMANVAMLDRWKISYKDEDAVSASVSTLKKDLKKDVVFNNYFGIGKYLRRVHDNDSVAVCFLLIFYF
jgi:hypothetical protein